MSLYLILLILSVSVPLLLSFDKKLHFYTRWKYVIPAIFLVAIIYIGFDVAFTRLGIWGFNAPYLMGVWIFGLPLEELLFFIFIPYASLFLHYAVILYFPKLKLAGPQTRFLTFFLLLSFLLIALVFSHLTYTFYIALKSMIVLVLMYVFARESLSYFYITFLLILFPFTLVNGVLTGSFIHGSVVWYNDDENLGYRFFTIPIEDFAYAFSMLALSLGVIDFVQRKKRN